MELLKVTPFYSLPPTTRHINVQRKAFILHIRHSFTYKSYLFVSGTSAFAAQSNYIINTNDVRFTRIRFNEGNDYNATTGVFTCRIPGIYWFSATLSGNSGWYCYFLLNRVHKLYIAFPGGNWDIGSVSEVFRLSHGDRVQVGHCSSPGNIRSDSANSFSGVLVKADG